ncbi:bifunctional folylpolyglutamate synthase/dihydrofolate synthase [Gluconacetobacter liquefaciens]|uniref:Dihydrofolate synthase/folylpolyglutamate synthase n=1 Tax=Gluconacetobacter liquefaciens TaxID=89584 RepID=A0A370G9D6_GLULI|nr:folylpolyglutamate synthase/dihydrofolate synthase family protein [Gluconacetobacter liquefaciens]MBB2184917.1 bifunctional folylpolyglutamate synthase/dihydrofolate synthase [Gluconacetobacter liquefaciens]RDI40341.1 dihydrofolate synthase/folylpolyglutamate synthase [Gluconacetobacter liquefaciens]GEB38206.1 bifunctional folylpolyglutamate synthase/dihydrofolate synthase [Gluconacetobacter liquefaciens]
MNSSPTALGPEFVGRAGAVLERLNQLYPALIDLSLGRLEALLGRLGHPENHLPPVIHVAGTNGKGSTCANLRAIGEAAGWPAHVMTSPHLVDVTERFRVAGRIVSTEELVAVLEEVERVNDGAPITVFEVLTAAGFVLFARHPARLAVIEVGLGGRFDATNVLARPAACAIASISMDHEAFLGNSLAAIAAEKAGIMKPGVPVVTGYQAPEAMAVLRARAAECGARLLVRDEDWEIMPVSGGVRYTDALGVLDLPAPGLPGAHQVDNAGLAVAALRASGLAVPETAWAGIARTEWPARLQRLDGALAALLPPGWEVWLDGGHNPGAGHALADMLAGWSDRPVHLVVGMKQTKDATGFLAPLLERAASVQAVAEPGQHLALPVEAIVAASSGRAMPGPTVRAALARLAEEADGPGRVVICGSLYLAGVVLAQDGWVAK